MIPRPRGRRGVDEREILEFCSEERTLSAVRLGLGICYSVVRRALESMAARGLVSVRREGVRVYYRKEEA